VSNAQLTGVRRFFDLYSRDEVTAEQIDDFVGRWHDAADGEGRSLSEYLGMTEEEYGVWLMDPETLPVIRAARVAGLSLAAAIGDYVATLRLAGRPVDRSALLALGSWLGDQGRGL
jgi:hypothetical protein